MRLHAPAILLLIMLQPAVLAQSGEPTLEYEVVAPLGRLPSMGVIRLRVDADSIHARNRLVAGWLEADDGLVRLFWRYPRLSSSLARTSVPSIFRRLMQAEGITLPRTPPSVLYGGTRNLPDGLGTCELYVLEYSSGTRLEIWTSRELPDSPLLRELMVQLAGAVSNSTESFVKQLAGTPVSVVFVSQSRGEIELLMFRGISDRKVDSAPRFALPLPFARLLERIID